MTLVSTPACRSRIACGATRARLRRARSADPGAAKGAQHSVLQGAANTVPQSFVKRTGQGGSDDIVNPGRHNEIWEVADGVHAASESNTRHGSGGDAWSPWPIMRNILLCVIGTAEHRE